MLSGLTRLLANPLTQTYLPNSQRKVRKGKDKDGDTDKDGDKDTDTGTNKDKYEEAAS